MSVCDDVIDSRRREMILELTSDFEKHAVNDIVMYYNRYMHTILMYLIY